MAQLTIYRSTDASAPVLTGQTGSLIALLDACLVNGYGSKSAAGWGHPFAGSSTKQVYRGGTGIRFYLRVLDDGSLTGSFRDCGVRGGESMSDVDTFTNPFPTVAQQTNGLNWRKSNTADATARPWVILADDRTVYVMIQSGDSGSTAGFWPLFVFGEYFSYKAADAHNSILIGATTFTAGTLSFGSTGSYQGDEITGGMQTTLGGHYIARIAAETGTSVACHKKGAFHLTHLQASSHSVDTLYGSLAYPNAADGGIYIHPLWVMDGTTPDVVHGELRGCHHCCHFSTFFSDDDTIPGAPGSGKTYLIKKKTPGNPNSISGLAGIWCFETSNTLRTN